MPRHPAPDCGRPGTGRATLALALVLALASASGIRMPASAQDAKRAETIEGLVRLVGAQAGIVLYCRTLYTIDDRVSDGLSQTVRRALGKALGPRQARAAIDAEGRRVAKEIEAVGAEQWCADQRDILNTDGVRVFAD